MAVVSIEPAAVYSSTYLRADWNRVRWGLPAHVVAVGPERVEAFMEVGLCHRAARVHSDYAATSWKFVVRRRKGTGYVWLGDPPAWSLVTGKEMGWLVPKLNKGFRYIVDGKKIVARDAPTGAPLPEGVLLAAVGGKLADGGDPIFYWFRCYLSADFGALGLFT